MLYVISHKSPDTDTIISSLVYQNFLEKMGVHALAIRLGEPNNETNFILNYVDQEKPELMTTLEAGSKVALVDHNEYSQTIDNIDELSIEAIIDHHKIGNISSKETIFIRIEKIGCTCSILAKMFIENNVKITPNIAKLMLSAIISDTLYFRSPTTTNQDINIVSMLNKIAKIEDLEAYSLEMFNAKSSLDGLSPQEIVKMDYKVFNLKDKKVGIGTIETTHPKFAMDSKEDLLIAMRGFKETDGLDISILSIIDILNQKNHTLIPSEYDASVVKAVFGVDTINNIADLGNRISRKHDIIPFITAHFS